MVKDFKAFLLRGNLIEVAVGIVIGLKVKDIVDAIVAGLITPLIGMIGGKDFGDMNFTINGSVFHYGLVINAIIAFVSVAAVIFFFVVKPMNVLAERRKRGEGQDDVPPTQEELLTEIRDLLAANAK